MWQKWQKMNYRIFATFAIMWQKWQKDELRDFALLPSCGNSRMNYGIFALLPSCGKSGKRMNYGIFALFAIMWQKWQKDELWDFYTFAIMWQRWQKVWDFCHFCHHVAKWQNGILATFVQTLGANIWPGVDVLKSCCACARL